MKYYNNTYVEENNRSLNYKTLNNVILRGYILGWNVKNFNYVSGFFNVYMIFPNILDLCKIFLYAVSY